MITPVLQNTHRNANASPAAAQLRVRSVVADVRMLGVADLASLAHANAYSHWAGMH
ncbi:MAG: hypothetical protein AAF460_13535 [Pseudomonadota bacterium]